MRSRLVEPFEDRLLVDGIRLLLPQLFHLAEVESSKAGRVGIQVGSLREQTIVALLMCKFGEASAETDVATTEPEADVRLFGQSLSIKTATGKRLGGAKLMWTVDADKVREFRDAYLASADMLLVHIAWGSTGALHFVPVEAQQRCLEQVGRASYMKLPRRGTNPRGVEISREALAGLVQDPLSRCVSVDWVRPRIGYDPYQRWIGYWRYR